MITYQLDFLGFSFSHTGNYGFQKTWIFDLCVCFFFSFSLTFCFPSQNYLRTKLFFGSEKIIWCPQNHSQKLGLIELAAWKAMLLWDGNSLPNHLFPLKNVAIFHLSWRQIIHVIWSIWLCVGSFLGFYKNGAVLICHRTGPTWLICITRTCCANAHCWAVCFWPPRVLTL